MGRLITALILLSSSRLVLSSDSFTNNRNVKSSIPSEEELLQRRSKLQDGVQPTPDPTVALEGQCVVVCDADVIGSRTMTPSGTRAPQPADSFNENVGTTSTANTDWYISNSGGFRLGSVKQSKIAFSVMRKSNLGVPDFNAADRRTIQFDYIAVNLGNGFDSESSTFVAPAGGTYSFAFHIYKLYNKRALTVSLTVNGIQMLTGFADRNTGDHEMAHNSGLIHLRRQDKVNIEIINGDLDGGWKFSTFSGHLLYEDDF